MLPVILAGVGYHLPRRVVGSAELEQRLGLCLGRCERATGIRERRAEGETTVGMAAAAARMAIEHAGIDPGRIDLVLDAGRAAAATALHRGVRASRARSRRCFASCRRAMSSGAARSGRSRSRSAATAARCPSWRASWNARPGPSNGTCWEGARRDRGSRGRAGGDARRAGWRRRATSRSDGAWSRSTTSSGTKAKRPRRSRSWCAAFPTTRSWSSSSIDRQTRHGHRAEAAAAFDRACARFAGNRGALSSSRRSPSRSGEDRRALKTWQRLRKLDPGNEVVIIGLGEAQFQLGQKNEARATWAALRERVRPPVHGHLRLAEVLLEHDLGADAIVEAKRAQALEPKNIDPHRLLAQIFEHVKKINEAVAEWNTVLALADRKLPGGEQHAGAEARGPGATARPAAASGARPHRGADPAAARGRACPPRRPRRSRSSWRRPSSGRAIRPARSRR